MLQDSEISDTIDMLKKHFIKQLSPWECDFLESIEDQWETRRSLSEKQRAKLDEIAERLAGSHGR